MTGCFSAIGCTEAPKTYEIIKFNDTIDPGNITRTEVVYNEDNTTYTGHISELRVASRGQDIVIFEDDFTVSCYDAMDGDWVPGRMLEVTVNKNDFLSDVKVVD